MGHSKNRVHRRADFVAHVRQKLALGEVGRFCGIFCQAEFRRARRHLRLEIDPIFFELRLRGLALRNITHDGKHLFLLADPGRAQADLDPEQRSVGLARQPFECLRTCRPRLPDFRHCLRFAEGRHIGAQVTDVHRTRLFAAEAEHLAHALVHLLDLPARCIVNEDGVIDRIENRMEALLAGAQGQSRTHQALKKPTDTKDAERPDRQMRRQQMAEILGGNLQIRRQRNGRADATANIAHPVALVLMALEATGLHQEWSHEAKYRFAVHGFARRHFLLAVFEGLECCGFPFVGCVLRPDRIKAGNVRAHA